MCYIVDACNFGVERCEKACKSMIPGTWMEVIAKVGGRVAKVALEQLLYSHLALVCCVFVVLALVALAIGRAQNAGRKTITIQFFSTNHCQ